MNLREGMRAFLSGVDPRDAKIQAYESLLARFIEICEPMAEAAGDFENASMIRTADGARAIAITVPCARFHEMRKHCELARYELESGRDAG